MFSRSHQWSHVVLGLSLFEGFGYRFNLFTCYVCLDFLLLPESVLIISRNFSFFSRLSVFGLQLFLVFSYIAFYSYKISGNAISLISALAIYNFFLINLATGMPIFLNIPKETTFGLTGSLYYFSILYFIFFTVIFIIFFLLALLKFVLIFLDS